MAAVPIRMVEPTDNAVLPTPVSLAREPAVETHRGHPRRRRRVGAGAGGRKTAFTTIPPWVWVVSLLLAGAGFFTSNPLLTPCAILAVPVIAWLLWFRGEPPVLAFACAMQWLQATVAVFYTDYYGYSLDAVFGGAELRQATWLSLIGVLVLAAGMRLVLINRQPVVAQVAAESLQLEPGKVFPCYLAGFIFFGFLERVAVLFPTVRQPLLATLSLRWVLVFLLFHAVITQRRHYALLSVALLMELVTGVLSFFGGFKDVIFIMLVALPLTRDLLRGWRLLTVFSLVAVLLWFSIVWTAVKGDYREFLNQGSGAQEVLVPVSQRLVKLGELLAGVKGDDITEGWNQVILRVSYVSLFAQCINNVPANIPHEHGALWLGAFKHVLMPRFLNPEKAAIDDSTQTVYYTGVQYAGAEEGTSIGIGYLAQSYIDFGRWGMFAPILLLGIFYGGTYRYFSSRKHKLLGMAMATAILIFTAIKVESNNVKLLGGNMISFIVMALFTKYFGGMLWHVITSRPATKSGRQRLGKHRRPNSQSADTLQPK